MPIYMDVSNTLKKNSVLQSPNLINFDAENPLHREAFIYWKRTGKWILKFNVEWPHLTVPDTIYDKLAERACAEEAEDYNRKKF